MQEVTTKGKIKMLADLQRFHSSQSGEDELTTLKDYIARMRDGQKDIYYIAGESTASIAQCPLTESFMKMGYEVLYLIDPIDE